MHMIHIWLHSTAPFVTLLRQSVIWLESGKCVCALKKDYISKNKQKNKQTEVKTICQGADITVQYPAPTCFNIFMKNSLQMINLSA